MPSSGLRSSRTQQELNEKPSLLFVAAAPPRSTSTINQPPSVFNSENKNSKSPLVPAGAGNQDGSGSKKRAYAYDWIANIKAAKHRLSCAELEDLDMSDVGRVVEGGRTTNLYNVNKHGAQYFISYDESQVYARVPHLYMKDTLICQAAALHISKLHGCSHPDDIELETNWQKLKDDSWVIHIHPKGGSAKKARS
ncbi:hypothetical protein PGQ11_009080 [Apiospora arundinis]|uniref:Uncharacterized protein n=1 Tax=Apiospora arundinis TaxID=335852 RepID=A0ABR2IHJ4_9PEZI